VFPIPFRNFRAAICDELQNYWYNGLNIVGLQKEIQRLVSDFRTRHTNKGREHVDNRALIFSPANNSECHGKLHPSGEHEKCFVSGRFRFGAALFPGFHYDVRASNGLLQSVFYDCSGNYRDLRPEKREYINVFPNSYLLPKRI
jgi:hypothetical protein